MKKYILILSLFIFIGLPSTILATSGACSWHGGVNCSAGSDFDGSVVCNDGYRDSSVYYRFTIECSVTPQWCSSEEWNSLIKEYGVMEKFAESDELDRQVKVIDEKLKTLPHYNDFLGRLTEEEQELYFQRDKLLIKEISIESSISRLLSYIDQDCQSLGAIKAYKNQLPPQILTSPLKTNDQICQDDFGINVSWDGTKNSDGTLNCQCFGGYVIGKDKKCIPMSSFCIEANGENSHPEGNQCFCNTGYFYDSSLKTCVIIQQEPVKNIPTTPTPSKSGGLASLLEKTVSEPPIEKEISNSVESPKEEVAPQIKSEPVKKVRWYQKIFNWIFR